MKTRIVERKYADGTLYYIVSELPPPKQFYSTISDVWYEDTGWWSDQMWTESPTPHEAMAVYKRAAAIAANGRYERVVEAAGGDR